MDIVERKQRGIDRENSYSGTQFDNMYVSFIVTGTMRTGPQQGSIRKPALVTVTVK